MLGVVIASTVSPDKSRSVELSRMLGSVRCIQTLLAVQKSASGKFGASSPLRLPQLLSLAVDFRE
jgi:hypothetical protein